MPVEERLADQRLNRFNMARDGRLGQTEFLRCSRDGAQTPRDGFLQIQAQFDKFFRSETIPEMDRCLIIASFGSVSHDLQKRETRDDKPPWTCHRALGGAREGAVCLHCHAVLDGKLVTGQNPVSVGAVAELLLEAVGMESKAIAQINDRITLAFEAASAAMAAVSSVTAPQDDSHKV